MEIKGSTSSSTHGALAQSSASCEKFVHEHGTIPSLRESELNRSAWVEINLDNFDYNVKSIQKKIGDECRIVGVIKADAYGHGAVACAHVLRENNCKIFAVATITEAEQLRDAGFDEKIICLGLILNEHVEMALQEDIAFTVSSLDNARAISDAAIMLRKQAQILIAVDTGMGRIGYQADDIEFAAREIAEIQKMPNLTIVGVISHLSTADELDDSYSKEQTARYEKFLDGLRKRGIDLDYRTFANSAAIMTHKPTHYDAVRPGIVMYGCYPSETMDKSLLDIRPVMSVKAQILWIKNVPAGFSVGYGRKFIAPTSMRVATLGIGYADGLPRAYSGKASVLIHGVRCPILGNICMDQCMVDVSAVYDAEIGEVATIMGADEEGGAAEITADDIARATNTINYEILCGFGLRLPKRYLRS